MTDKRLCLRGGGRPWLWCLNDGIIRRMTEALFIDDKKCLWVLKMDSGGRAGTCIRYDKRACLINQATM